MSDASGKPENAQEKVATSPTSTVTSLGLVITAMGTVEEREAGNVIEGKCSHGTYDTRCYMHIPCTVMMAVAEAELTVFIAVQV